MENLIRTLKIICLNCYRLKSNCLTENSCKNYDSQDVDETARHSKNYMGYSSSKKHTEIGKGNFIGIDNLNELKILRLMTKPVYIMAQYVATLELAEVISNDAGNYKCNCIFEQNEPDFHFCPAHPKYMPFSFCRKHIECNDPIYLCFDMAKLCIDFGNRASEYSEECKNMSTQIIEFSVKLLHQCCNTEEVELLLSEKSGLSKYMRFVDKDVGGEGFIYKYPRLVLAAELNYKEFVGHMHCQQILRRQWHGGRNWEEESIFNKVAFRIIQGILFLNNLNL